MNNNNPDKQEQAAMEAAQERSAEPHLRDRLKREQDEMQKRPRNYALEKWGSEIDELIRRGQEGEDKDKLVEEMFRRIHAQSPEPDLDGPDFDR